MIRVAISVKGATKEEFANESLAPHLRHNGVLPTPVLIGPARCPVRGGGTVSIDRLVREMRHVSQSFDAVTSLADFYGFSEKGSKLPNDHVEEIRSRISQFDEGSAAVRSDTRIRGAVVLQCRSVCVGSPGCPGRRTQVNIGLGAIRSECPRFDAWLGQLEALGEFETRPTT